MAATNQMEHTFGSVRITVSILARNIFIAHIFSEGPGIA